MTKVLVFESDPAFAGELRSELGNLGCTVQVVDDGNVGMQVASSEKPDLILLSAELPRMNGFSVCNRLKRDPALTGVPLVILSSEATDDVIDQHMRLKTRAELYLRKPIAFADLLANIRTLVPLGGDGEAEPIALDEDEVIDDILEDDAESEEAEPEAEA
jgi:DNA-binding response OmpR family regulator